jgi:P27 family predicted phage terminase small subunit
MKGRKPTSDNVVPLKAEDGKGVNFKARAEARARELRPDELPFDVKAVWDRLAPTLCDPRKNRLDETSVFMFEQLCWLVSRYEKLRLDVRENGETYESDTRNGKQVKSRPEVGQLNEVFRQVRSLANEFGMTPASERAVQGSGQMGFNFDDDGDDFD